MNEIERRLESLEILITGLKEASFRIRRDFTVLVLEGRIEKARELYSKLWDVELKIDDYQMREYSILRGIGLKGTQLLKEIQQRREKLMNWGYYQEREIRHTLRNKPEEGF